MFCRKMNKMLNKIWKVDSLIVPKFFYLGGTREDVEAHVGTEARSRNLFSLPYEIELNVVFIVVSVPDYEESMYVIAVAETHETAISLQKSLTETETEIEIYEINNDLRANGIG